MRCESCQKITLADLRLGQEILQQPSFTALKNSAESGCDLCNLSYTAITSTYAPTDPDFLAILRHEQSGQHSGEHGTEVRLQGLISDIKEWIKYPYKMETILVEVGHELSSNTVHASLNIYADTGTPPAKYVAGRMPFQNAGDPYCLSRVRGWVQHCGQKHPKCDFLSTKRPLPKRILEIEGKLIVRITNAEYDRYVALSYCWGSSGKNILLTRKKDSSDTKSTFDMFTSDGIEMDTLPKTIQDAIIVCRTLGIKYLWVDALCIVQKEPDLADFKAEAPRMSEYYSNAYLTLIAGSARDCTDGFLSDRAKPQAPPCDIEYNRTNIPPDGSDKEITGTVHLGLPSGQANGHIVTRAWTYQEMFLSRRSLTYGPSQVIFSCPSGQKLEDGDFRLVSPLDKNWSAVDRRMPSFHDVIEHADKAEATKYVNEIWLRRIFAYTSRNLSDTSDKLAAIAGTARLLQGTVQCKYMYGLWENDMIRGLSWRTIKPWLKNVTRGIITRDMNRAPSWSWASINGAVQSLPSQAWEKAFQDSQNVRLKVLSHENVSGALDPIRENVDAPKAFALGVRGMVKRVWHIPIMPLRATGIMFVDYEPSFSILGFIEYTQDVKEEYVALGTWDTFEDYEERRYWGRQVHALLLISGYGLLLTHVDSNRYRRIGHFWHPKEKLFKNVDLEDITLI